MIRKTRAVLYPAACLAIVLGLQMGLQSTRAQLQLGAPATITLRVVDSYGKPLEYKVENFYARDQPDVNLAAQFEGLTFRHAAQGKMYEFRLAPVHPAIQYPPFKQWIATGGPSIFAVFSIPKAILSPDRDTPWPVTKLVIQPVPYGEDVWVNVRPAFGPDISGIDTSETAAVNKDGSFTLHGTHGGLYLVTVYQGSRILHLAVVDIPQFAPPEPIEINLDGCVVHTLRRTPTCDRSRS